MTTFHGFPSIEQFKDTVREAHRNGLHRMTFVGSVKLHGTNAAIVRHPDGSITTQSRSRVITVDDDNYGFAAFVAGLPEDVLRAMFSAMPVDKTVAIFGEWAGKGINHGAAVCQMERFFSPFAVRVIVGSEDDEDYWLDPASVECSEAHRVLPGVDIPDRVEVVFTSPTSVAEAAAKFAAITEAVEASCPFAARYGVTGIGEGVVWVGDEDPSSRFWFKVKGEKHSVSKVRTLVPVDVEKVRTVEEFVARVVTDNRLRQGIEAMKERGKPIDKSTTGDFIRWVVGDVVKEEADTMEASGLTMKDVGQPIGRAASAFWFANL